jgi:hypothetical protein
LSPDVIYSRDTDLRIAIYPVDEIPFIPHEDEIQLYGFLNGELLVFETVNISPDDALEVLAAIMWYTSHVGCPSMEILPEDPRMETPIAVAL